MTVFVFKRLLIIPIILLLLSGIIFSLTFFLTPTQRAAVFISSPDELHQVDIEDLIVRYELDQPFYQQYTNWLIGILKGDWGWSTSHRMPVLQVLRHRIPATIELMLLGQGLIIMGTFLLSIIATYYENRIPDIIIRFLTTLWLSIPNFVTGILLLVLFYVQLDFFAPGRLSLSMTDIVYSSQFTNYTGMHLLDAILNRRVDVFINAFSHLVLPGLAYALSPVASNTRIMRSSMLDQKNSLYTDTARMKGVSEIKIMSKHVFRNALIPTVTMMGMQIPTLVGGSVIIETIFNFPGMGLFVVTAARGLDFAAIIGASLAICILIMISNLLVDIVYGVLNPKVRVERYGE